MLFELVDVLQRRRRFLYVAVFIVIDFWLLTFCSQTLQAHRTDITARISSATSAAQTQYQGDNFFGSDLVDGFGRALNVVEADALRATVATTDGFTATERGMLVASRATLQATGTAAIFAALAAKTAIIWVIHAYFFPYIAAAHGVGYVVKAASGATHNGLASVIQPQQDAKVPVITPEQAQQAFSIQEGTLAVTPIKPTGSGGACDNGAGNGGYPMDWCNARMDSLHTNYYGGAINRECTSYAYWYFTAVEGHADFYVTGNANRWARTANYPIHELPAVGAIAVETTGAYGHVAIVQALPGQAYEGETVPNGYVLVSEMNYDWQGHFRYSYSPLSKFSAYIYP